MFKTCRTTPSWQRPRQNLTFFGLVYVLMLKNGMQSYVTRAVQCLRAPLMGTLRGMPQAQQVHPLMQTQQMVRS